MSDLQPKALVFLKHHADFSLLGWAPIYSKTNYIILIFQEK